MPMSPGELRGGAGLASLVPSWCQETWVHKGAVGGGEKGGRRRERGGEGERKGEQEGGKEHGGGREEAGELAGFPPPTVLFSMGFPAGSDGKQSACNAGDPGSIPGSGISPREWRSTPVFLPGKFHGQRSFVGYSP